jgi:hypothetical protein
MRVTANYDVCPLFYRYTPMNKFPRAPSPLGGVCSLIVHTRTAGYILILHDALQKTR